jgi:hypothetical protein
MRPRRNRSQQPAVIEGKIVKPTDEERNRQSSPLSDDETPEMR